MTDRTRPTDTATPPNAIETIITWLKVDSNCAPDRMRAMLHQLAGALDIQRGRTTSAEKLLAETTAERDRLRPMAKAHEQCLAASAEREYRNSSCDYCTCCTTSGCHTGPDSTCPTDTLGDSVCPCTGD